MQYSKETQHGLCGAPTNYRRQRRSDLELCADVIVSAAAARRPISVGGGAVPKNRRRRRGAAWAAKKQFFLRFTKKFRSILKIFLGTFLVIKALRFAMLAGS